MNILLADDDSSSRLLIVKFLTRLGYNVAQCADGQEALRLYTAQQHFDVVLSDIRMPNLDGIGLLRAINVLPEQDTAPVILMSAHADVNTAITALRLGAYDYLVKPVNIDELTLILDRIREYKVLKAENTRLKERFDVEVQAVTAETRQEIDRLKRIALRSVGLEEIGFFSAPMQQIASMAKKFHKDRSVPVLIQGETGCGKEIIAKLIHHGHDVNDRPFVDLNCAAITPNLFESELFGYEAGAFTGGLAKGQKGKLDIASGGTLFLDEVGDMPLELQAKLLRVLQEKQYYRVGGLRRVQADVRVICATNANLEQKVADGVFREDLYYRLKVGHILIPPLRERREDIIPLAELFVRKFCNERKRIASLLSVETVGKLQNHHWPGNVRELKNTMDLATLLHDVEVLCPEHITLRDGTILKPATPKAASQGGLTDIPRHPFSLEQYIDSIVLQALEINGGNKTETARYLGLSRRALCYRLDTMKTSQ